MSVFFVSTKREACGLSLSLLVFVFGTVGAFEVFAESFHGFEEFDDFRIVGDEGVFVYGRAVVGDILSVVEITVFENACVSETEMGEQGLIDVVGGYVYVSVGCVAASYSDCLFHGGSSFMILLLLHPARAYVPELRDCFSIMNLL